MFRDVAEFFEHRQIAVRLHIAHRPWVTVPVPGAAEVTALLNDTDVVETGLAEAAAHQQTTESTANNHDVDVVGDRLALGCRCVRIVDEVREVASDLDVLRVGVGTDTLVALFEIFRLQLARVEVDATQRLVQHIVEVGHDPRCHCRDPDCEPGVIGRCLGTRPAP